MLLLVIFTFSLQAEPIFAISSPLWKQNNTIYIANCAKPSETLPITRVVESLEQSVSSSRHSIEFIKPPSETDKSFTFLDIAISEYKEKKHLYAVSSEQENTLTNLYCFVPNQEKPEVVYKVPFGLKTATLLIREIKIDNKFSKLLLLTGNNLKSSFAALFDITSSGIATNLILKYEGKLQTINQAKFIRVPNKGWTILFAGQDVNGAGALHFVFLEKKEPPLTLKTIDKHPIQTIMALDTEQTHEVKELLAWDEGGGIWEMTLAPLSSPKKIASHPILARGKSPSKLPTVVAVRNIFQPGISVYFLGNHPYIPSSLSRLDKIENGGTKITPIDPSNLKIQPAALYTRFGRIILIPQNINDYPTTFDLNRNRENQLATPWTNVLKASLIPYEPSKSTQLSQAQLLWDPIEEKEVLVSLNQNCELSVTSAPVTQDKYGRMLWRKIN